MNLSRLAPTHSGDRRESLTLSSHSLWWQARISHAWIFGTPTSSWRTCAAATSLRAILSIPILSAPTCRYVCVLGVECVCSAEDPAVVHSWRKASYLSRCDVPHPYFLSHVYTHPRWCRVPCWMVPTFLDATYRAPTSKAPACVAATSTIRLRAQSPLSRSAIVEDFYL